MINVVLRSYNITVLKGSHHAHTVSQFLPQIFPLQSSSSLAILKLRSEIGDIAHGQSKDPRGMPSTRFDNG